MGLQESYQGGCRLSFKKKYDTSGSARVNFAVSLEDRELVDFEPKFLGPTPLGDNAFFEVMCSIISEP